jgi:hypothetical protein
MLGEERERENGDSVGLDTLQGITYDPAVLFFAEENQTLNLSNSKSPSNL